ncbi:hypothetical protein THRCLA_23328 [Thraustotheca clavata]|uniref:4'-phosphopantetheinyl transferase domain-containing protein n=1 Tax=Thraustotheca clavata TaxID=74557 RepID=A0A1V9Y7F2_9STRA|nr:hypothetical protein THRCLA_23328 [Thraustotheca clavata]
MGIYGIGVDLVKTVRVHQTYRVYGDRFLKRFLHPKEIDHFKKLCGTENQAQFLASRWAVKEATLKAFKSWRIIFPEVLIVKEPLALPDHILNNRALPPRKEANVVPRLAFDGATLALSKAIGIQHTHVSLSHDGEYTIAKVLLED